jgi:predicted Rossmann fold flavoprotein
MFANNMSAAQHICIIGGGAAGFFGAIRCAELYPQYKVTILERGNDVLGKVRISGGGRCNVTHACFIPRELTAHYPRGSRELLGPFMRFACGDTMDWFESRGVLLKTEDDGRVFPQSDSSSSIVNCLMQAASKAGVNVQMNTRLDDILPPDNQHAQWRLITAVGTIKADKVLVASGSNTRIWDMLSRLQHHIIPPVPSLFTFNIKDKRIESLMGLSVPMAFLQVSGTNLRAQGPLLITHWGLSGPAILRLSAWGARELAERRYHVNLVVNWLGLSPNEADETIELLRSEHGKKNVAAQAQFGLPSRLWRTLCEAASPKLLSMNWADLSKGLKNKLLAQLTSGEFTVTGKSTFKDEFVTAGGVDLREVNFKTFESKLHPGLFFAGEVLDIDAITGGFNFQAAWTGGWIAGEAIGQ